MTNHLPIKLGENYLIRLLDSVHHHRGYCSLLSHLTECPELTLSQFEHLIEYEMIPEKGYYIIVIEDLTKSRIIASVTLLVEQKIIHRGAKVGHIEDVVVHPDYRGQRLAQTLLEVAQDTATNLKCYKILLNCKPELVKFYEKSNYQEVGRECRLDLN